MSFQLPLSGSLLRPIALRQAIIIDLSTPSLGITIELQGIDDASDEITFNSLSRDH